MKVNQYWISTATKESETGTPVYKNNGSEEVIGFVEEAQESRVRIVLFDEVEESNLPLAAYDARMVDSMAVLKEIVMSPEVAAWWKAAAGLT